MAGERMSAGYQALTEKEKQTLRLITQGHDAKSLARHLGLSVHTVNERLRESRRKMGVSSSREAARQLFASERPAPDCVMDKQLGVAPTSALTGSAEVAHNSQAPIRTRLGMLVAGASFMCLVFAALSSSSASQSDQVRSRPLEVADPTAEQAARDWLALVDEGDWDTSFARAGAAFRRVNSAAGWAEASQQGRAPLGRTGGRQTLEQRSINAPPAGYREVRFRSAFAGKGEATETVTLEREKNEWRVVGYVIQ